MRKPVIAIVTALLLSALAAQLSDLGAWTYQINGSGNVEDKAQAVAVDAAGDVYAAGYLNRDLGSLLASSWVVVKLSGDSGEALWRREFPGSYLDGATSLALDGSGGLIVGGGFNSRFALKKLSQQDGSTLWERELPGSYSAPDTVNAVIVGPGNDVFAAGFISHLGSQADFTAVRLAGSDGSVIWVYSVDGPSHLGEGAGDLAWSPGGEVVVTGALTHVQFTFHPDLLTVALSPLDGHEVWRFSSEFVSGRSVALDADGGVLVAGGGFPGLTGLPALKLDSGAGTEDWHTSVTGDNGGSGFAAADTAGDLFIAGRDTRLSDSASEFVVARLSGGTGVNLWLSTPFGAAADFQGAWAIRLDGAGSPVAAGEALGSGSGRDLAVVKLDPATGATIWQTLRTGPGEAEDSALACAIDGAGDVVAAGYISGSTSRQDFTVVKLSGQTGHDFQKDPLGLLQALMDEVGALHLSPGLTTSLQAKLRASARLLQDTSVVNDRAAGRPITAFIQQVKALKGGQISQPDAEKLIADAQAILDALAGSSSLQSGSAGTRDHPLDSQAPGGEPAAGSPRPAHPLPGR